MRDLIVHLHLGCSPSLSQSLRGVFGDVPIAKDLPVAEQNVTIGGRGVRLVLKPTHAGQPVDVDGPATVTLDDPALFTVTQSADDAKGLTFDFVPTGAVGSTNGTATVDAKLGPDVNDKTFAFTLHAIPAEADTLDGAFTDLDGTPPAP